MNIEQKAFLAVKKAIESKKKLPLTTIKSKFLPAIEEVKYSTRKFYTLDDIDMMLDQANENGMKVYLKDLYEMEQFGMDLQPTGSKYYCLKCCMKDSNSLA